MRKVLRIFALLLIASVTVGQQQPRPMTDEEIYRTRISYQLEDCKLAAEQINRESKRQIEALQKEIAELKKKLEPPK